MSAPAFPASLQKSLDATKVEYVNMGTSGLRVSVPILGGMSLGSSEWGSWVLDEEPSLEILKAAYDRGITTWDTANMYSNGVSEQVIGKAIKKFNIPREKLVLMTKCALHVGEEVGMHTPPFTQQLNQSKDYVNQGGEFIDSKSTIIRELTTDSNQVSHVSPFSRLSTTPWRA